jgi:regulator of protease activity HflC (stomatin/prohibitin superfamily)
LRLGGIFTVLLVSVLGGLMSFLRTVTGVTYVRNNEVALKLRFHRAQRERTSPYVIWLPGKFVPWRPHWVRKEDRCQGSYIIGYTGLHGGIPFIDHWAKLCLSEEPERTDDTLCILADQMGYSVVGTLRWKILGNLESRTHSPDDIFNAHFATRDLRASIRNCAEQCMVSVLSYTTYPDFVKKPEEVCQEIKNELEAITGLWGVEIIEVGFASRRATPRTEMLTQLPALKGLSFERLEGRETLIAALTGAMTLAAQASHEQHSELNGNDTHEDVHKSHLGVLHGLPQQEEK